MNTSQVFIVGRLRDIKLSSMVLEYEHREYEPKKGWHVTIYTNLIVGMVDPSLEGKKVAIEATIKGEYIILDKMVEL